MPATEIRRRAAAHAEDFRRFARLTAAYLHAPVAVVSLLQDEAPLSVGEHDAAGFDAPVAELEPVRAANRAVAHGGRSRAIRDFAASSETAASTEPLGGVESEGVAPRSYLGLPLRSAAGQVLGTLAVLDVRPREWTARELSLLEDLATAGSAMIELHVQLERLEREQRARRDSEARFRAVFHNAAIGIALIDTGGRPLESNAALQQMLGYSADELAALTFDDLSHPDDLETDSRLSAELMAGARASYQVEKRFFRKDGDPQWVHLTVSVVRNPDGSPRFGVGVVEDIAVRKQAEEALVRLSTTDELTGLHNRRGFLTLAEQQWKQARRKHEPVTVMYGDLDRFKQINDTYGHLEGDRALQETARLLRSVYRETDIIGRIGGDEFVVLLVEAKMVPDAVLVQRVQDRINLLNRSGVLPFPLALSTGLARRTPDEGGSLEELLDEADRRMYQHKQARRGG